MKHLRKFDSVSEMNTVIANSTIGILGLAYNNGTPVMQIKSGGSPVPPTPSYTTPFYVENITQETETLTIEGYSEDESTYNEIPVEYSTDGTNWSSLGTTGATPLTRTLQSSDKVYLRATTNTWAWMNDKVNYGCTIYGVSKVGGNIMSLLYGSSFTGNETTFPTESTFNFADLFNGMVNKVNTVLVSASELILPATTLAVGCYVCMFSGCTSLTTAPSLPATTLAEGCYDSMFSGCTSLTTAPTLPATTLANSCYNNMFSGCTSLTTAPTLPATTLAEGCYSSMFNGCTSLTTAPSLPATTLTNGCYAGMFMGCTSLTSVPELPATTLADDCCDAMFSGCTSLTSAPTILPATTLVQDCYFEMFMDCTSLTTAPSLPATTLTNGCYAHMFNGCTNLNHIQCLATDISANMCTKNWMNGVASTGTFVKNKSMESWTTGANGIPEGWTVQDTTT